MDDNQISFTRYFKLNLVKLVISLIILLIAILISLRLTGNLPYRYLSPQQKVVTNADAKADQYLLIASIDSLLYYYDRNNGKFYRYSVDKNGFEVMDVAASISNVENAYIAPNDEKIALLSASEPDRSGIFVLNMNENMRPSDQKRNQVVSDIIRNDQLPIGFSLQKGSIIAWSPDSLKVAFTASDREKSDIFIYDTVAKRLVSLRCISELIYSLLWTEGQRIVFASRRNARDGIFVVNSDASGLAQIK